MLVELSRKIKFQMNFGRKTDKNQKRLNNVEFVVVSEEYETTVRYMKKTGCFPNIN